MSKQPWVHYRTRVVGLAGSTPRYGSGVEWTKLILDFVSQIAWPLIVLILGLRFRKPIMKLLADNGPMKRFSAGPVSAEWVAAEGVDNARESLESDYSEPPTKASKDGSAEPGDSTAPEHAGNGTDDVVPVPPHVDEKALQDEITVLPGNLKRLVDESPGLAILESGRLLEFSIRRIAAKINAADMEDAGLDKQVDYLNSIGVLTNGEARAVSELLETRHSISRSPFDQYAVTRNTATEYARMCMQIRASARERARYVMNEPPWI